MRRAAETGRCDCGCSKCSCKSDRALYIGCGQERAAEQRGGGLGPPRELANAKKVAQRLHPRGLELARLLHLRLLSRQVLLERRHLPHRRVCCPPTPAAIPRPCTRAPRISLTGDRTDSNIRPIVRSGTTHLVSRRTQGSGRRRPPQPTRTRRRRPQCTTIGHLRDKGGAACTRLSARILCKSLDQPSNCVHRLWRGSLPLHVGAPLARTSDGGSLAAPSGRWPAPAGPRRSAWLLLGLSTCTPTHRAREGVGWGARARYVPHPPLPRASRCVRPRYRAGPGTFKSRPPARAAQPQRAAKSCLSHARLARRRPPPDGFHSSLGNGGCDLGLRRR